MKSLVFVALALAVVLCLGDLEASTADTKDQYTYGNANGRMWVRMTDAEKVFFLVGLHDGLGALRAFSSDKEAAEKFTCECTFRELRAGIDGLYAADPAYARVPVVMMFRLQVERAKGATREQVEKEISDYLKNLSASE